MSFEGVLKRTLVFCTKIQNDCGKEPFTVTDFDGNTPNNDMFGNYDVTIVNFQSNTCGSCIAEIPELEACYHDFKEKNINLIGVAVSAGDSQEEHDLTDCEPMEYTVTVKTGCNPTEFDPQSLEGKICGCTNFDAELHDGAFPGAHFSFNSFRDIANTMYIHTKLKYNKPEELCMVYRE